MVIPEAVITDKTSLVTPDSCIPAGRDNPQALVRYNIRLAAEEDPILAEHVLDWQAGIDPFGRGGCYDKARPELACSKKRVEDSFWQGLRTITFKVEPDRVGEFLSEAGITRAGFSYNISWLYSRYCAWCLEKGHMKLCALAFSRDMRRRGFTLLRREEAAS